MMVFDRTQHSSIDSGNIPKILLVQETSWGRHGVLNTGRSSRQGPLCSATEDSLDRSMGQYLDVLWLMSFT